MENNPTQFEWIWRYLMEVARITPDRPIGEVFEEVTDVWEAARGVHSPEEAARLQDEQSKVLGS